MGKYGSGVSMKTVIESEVADAEMLLQDQPEEVREEVLNIIKEMAYQWCSTNAIACAMEDAIQQCVPDSQQRAIMRQTVVSGVREKVFAKTYPFD